MNLRTAIFAFATLSTSVLLAQTTPIVVTPGTGGVFSNNSSGNYNFQNITQDNTAVMNKILEQNRDLQQIDREYLNGIQLRLNKHLDDLLDLRNKFIQLGQKAQFGTVDVFAYLNLVNEITSKLEVLNKETQTQTLMTRESLPSYTPIEVGDKKIVVNTSGAVNMGPLMERVNLVKTKITDDIKAVRFAHLVNEKTAQNFAVNENALAPNFGNVQLLSPEERTAMNDEISLNNTLTTATDSHIQKYVDGTITLINTYVNNHGVKEVLRQEDENDRKAINEDYVPITDAFFRLSYLRKKTGWRLGAIQPDPEQGYSKAIFNLEKFGLALQPLKLALSALTRNRAKTDSDTANAFETIRNFIQLYDEKITPVFKMGSTIRKTKKAEGDPKMDYSSNDTGFLVRANSTITFLSGQRTTAELMLMIFRLVLADVREERMLLDNDREGLATFHDARYRSTEELKLKANKKICQMDWDLSDKVFAANCVPLGIKTKPKQLVSNSGGGLADHFSNLIAANRNIESGRRAKAANLQALIDAANAASKTPEEQAAEDSAGNDLFN